LRPSLLVLAKSSKLVIFLPPIIKYLITIFRITSLGATGYTPSRWALLGFSTSLQADLYDTNFKLSMIALGKVSTPYFKNNPTSEDRIPKIVDWLIPTMSEEAAGKIIARTVKSKATIVIRPFMMKVSVWLNRLFPGLFRWMMRTTGYKENK